MDSPSFTDALGQRLRWAVLASLLINMGIWRAAAAIARRPAHFNPPPVEITRVILDKNNPGGRYSALAFFWDNKVPVWRDGAHKEAHNKVMLIDGRTIITENALKK